MERFAILPLGSHGTGDGGGRERRGCESSLGHTVLEMTEAGGGGVQFYILGSSLKVFSNRCGKFGQHMEIDAMNVLQTS